MEYIELKGILGIVITRVLVNATKLNALPVASLVLKNPDGSSEEQLPFKLLTIVVRISLIYFWAFLF